MLKCFISSSWMGVEDCPRHPWSSWRLWFLKSRRWVFFGSEWLPGIVMWVQKENSDVRDFQGLSCIFPILNEELFWHRSESSSHQERVDDEMVDVFLVTHQDDGMRVFMVRYIAQSFFKAWKHPPKFHMEPFKSGWFVDVFGPFPFGALFRFHVNFLGSISCWCCHFFLQTIGP